MQEILFRCGIAPSCGSLKKITSATSHIELRVLDQGSTTFPWVEVRGGFMRNIDKKGQPPAMG